MKNIAGQRLLVVVLSFLMFTIASGDTMNLNLLLNPSFEFHSFKNHRSGRQGNSRAGNVAFWNTDAYGDIEVNRESHVGAEERPAYSAHNIVSIEPGKRFWQFITLPEIGVAVGEKLSLMAGGYQTESGALEASILLMKLDNEEGQWSPSDYGVSDKRTFDKKARGDLIVAEKYSRVSETTGAIELAIDGVEVIGRLQGGVVTNQGTDTIALCVEFANKSEKGTVHVYAPSLTRTETACRAELSLRSMQPVYRNIPRTMQKLWKGETLHIMIMGSSIDRGSANPPMYLYNEDPESAEFKQPRSDKNFDAGLIDRPDLEGQFGWWNHYFSYGGQLKLELMRKFDLPADKICLTFMACDGSCVGEAHSGLSEYFELKMPPSANYTGHGAGSWNEICPGLFERTQGPAPDLVIFGSGANEKTDTPDEVAVFEGMIRWIQRHSPHTEFLFSIFQNHGAYTSNAGDLMALSLRYQIPYMDYGKVADDIVRWCDRYALVPRDGHPQAVAHFLWFKQIEKAFECWDPIQAGIAQLQLPERAHPNTYGWEGDMKTFEEGDPRIANGRFVFEDTAVNCWVVFDHQQVTNSYSVDGVKMATRQTPMSGRDVRNSSFRHGRCTLGDRHILEMSGEGAYFVAVDAKVCPERRYYGVENGLWRGIAGTEEFASEWGAPFGERLVVLEPGSFIELDVPATDLSVAYLDDPEGGEIVVQIDDTEVKRIASNVPFTDIKGAEHWMENRKGIRGLGFGLHRVRIVAENAPVRILGLYTYDSRPNRSLERRLSGMASSGETLRFSLPFKRRPLVLCGGGLNVETGDIKRDEVVFSGNGNGWFDIIGE